MNIPYQKQIIPKKYLNRSPSPSPKIYIKNKNKIRHEIQPIITDNKILANINPISNTSNEEKCDQIYKKIFRKKKTDIFDINRNRNSEKFVQNDYDYDYKNSRDIIDHIGPNKYRSPDKQRMAHPFQYQTANHSPIYHRDAQLRQKQRYKLMHHKSPICIHQKRKSNEYITYTETKNKPIETHNYIQEYSDLTNYNFEIQKNDLNNKYRKNDYIEKHGYDEYEVDDDKDIIVKKIGKLKLNVTPDFFSNIKKYKTISKYELSRNNSNDSSPFKNNQKKNRFYHYNNNYNDISTKEDDSSN